MLSLLLLGQTLCGQAVINKPHPGIRNYCENDNRVGIEMVPYMSIRLLETHLISER